MRSNTRPNHVRDDSMKPPPPHKTLLIIEMFFSPSESWLKNIKTGENFYGDTDWIVLLSNLNQVVSMYRNNYLDV